MLSMDMMHQTERALLLFFLERNDEKQSHRLCHTLSIVHYVSGGKHPHRPWAALSSLQVPDSPSLKVFSKKKVAERAQHSLRSFPVPLRPSDADAAGPRATAAQVLGDPLVKVTVSENLPLDADDVVKRLRRSLQEFRQVGWVACLQGGGGGVGGVVNKQREEF